MATRKETVSPKTKTSPGSSKENMTLTNLHVAVMSAAKHKLSNSTLKVIYDVIRLHLTEQLKRNGKVPRFVGEPVFDGGVLKLTCLDEDTKQWVKDVVSKLPADQGIESVRLNDWFDTFVPKIPSLKVVTQKYLLNMTKCQILLPFDEYTSIEEVMKILDKMNPEVEVKKWFVDMLHDKSHFSSKYIFFDELSYEHEETTIKSIPVRIPNDIMDSIKTQLHFGLGTVTLEVVKDQKT